MDFCAVVDQVTELLWSRGRVSYRALRVQLQLADDAIEALKDELIYAQHVAVDEDGRVLVGDLVDSTVLANPLDPEE